MVEPMGQRCGQGAETLAFKTRLLVIKNVCLAIRALELPGFGLFGTLLYDIRDDAVQSRLLRSCDLRCAGSSLDDQAGAPLSLRNA